MLEHTIDTGREQDAPRGLFGYQEALREVTAQLQEQLRREHAAQRAQARAAAGPMLDAQGMALC